MFPSRPALRPRIVLRGSVALFTVFGAYLAIAACDNSSYPIDASFCDGWCRMLRRTSCDQEPENCVRDCENSLTSARCRDRQETLLACYEQAPASAFTCVGEGFQASIRPRPEICTEERQALIGCESPVVKACIDACEVLDQTPLPADAGASDGGVFDAGPVPESERCPRAPMPCEQLCWVLDATLRASGAELPDDASVTAIADLGAPVIRCAQVRARECHIEVARSEPGQAPALSWTRAFQECAGLPATAIVPP